jgi:hypothetical protein
MGKVQRHKSKQIHLSANRHTSSTTKTGAADQPPLSATSQPQASEDPMPCKQHVVAKFMQEVTKQEDTVWYA